MPFPGPLLRSLLYGIAAALIVFILLAGTLLTQELRAALMPRLPALAVVALLAGAAGSLVAWRRLDDAQRWPSRFVHALERLRALGPGLRIAQADDLPAAVEHSFNLVAAEWQAERTQRQAAIDRATQALATERDLFAAVIGELPNAVIACHDTGQILLYTPRAVELLNTHAPDRYLGLGRTIFSLFRRSAILHGLERMSSAAESASPSARVLLATREGALFHARFTPLRRGQASGFFLALEPAQVAPPETRIDHRHRLGNLRAAAEMLRDNPDLSEAERQRFVAIIDEESRRLVEALPQHDETQWPLEDTSAETLLALTRDAVAATTHQPVHVADPPALWLRCETFSLLAILRDYSARIAAEGASALRLEIMEEASQPQLRLCWSPAVVLPPDVWRRWQHTVLDSPGSRLPLSPMAIVRAHGGEIRQQSSDAGACLKLRMQASEPAEHDRDAHAAVPVWDVTAPPVHADPLDHPLRALSFTVLDTETTGLDPSGGDEIIAIGAIHIVNGRILSREVFESLVASTRRIDPAAQRLHGIDTQMLRGQPALADVLPRLARFCEGTVLVGHNLAFDRRFLELAADSSGVSLQQPGLDTLLLSQLLYPQAGAHTLEALAERLHVPVLGRHTALGDAILTAEILLRLIPMLEGRGYATLRQALDAAATVPLARLKY
ncbi:MAG: hypothetical protein K0U79_13130 [Gammaproteobacteria bacterium]|nr:hypothetical protein [Gammaproteobacteria bacterium]